MPVSLTGLGDLLDEIEEDLMAGLTLEEALELMLDENDDLVSLEETSLIARALKAGRITREELERSAGDIEIGSVRHADVLDGHAGMSALLTKSVGSPLVVELPPPDWNMLLAAWKSVAETGVRVLMDRSSAMATKPLGGERYPFGVRELSLVMSTDIDGHTSLRFIYWNAKQLDQMIGRVARTDLENKVILDVGTELRSWADATVIHPAIGCDGQIRA